MPSAVSKRAAAPFGRVLGLDKTHCGAKHDSKCLAGACFSRSEQEVGTRPGINLVELHREPQFRTEVLPVPEEAVGRRRR